MTLETAEIDFRADPSGSSSAFSEWRSWVHPLERERRSVNKFRKHDDAAKTIVRNDQVIGQRAFGEPARDRSVRRSRKTIARNARDGFDLYFMTRASTDGIQELRVRRNEK